MYIVPRWWGCSTHQLSAVHDEFGNHVYVVIPGGSKRCWGLRSLSKSLIKLRQNESLHRSDSPYGLCITRTLQHLNLTFRCLLDFAAMLYLIIHSIVNLPHLL